MRGVNIFTAITVDATVCANAHTAAVPPRFAPIAFWLVVALVIGNIMRFDVFLLIAPSKRVPNPFCSLAGFILPRRRPWPTSAAFTACSLCVITSSRS